MAKSSDRSAGGGAKRVGRAPKKRAARGVETASEQAVSTPPSVTATKTTTQPSQFFWQRLAFGGIRERDVVVFLRQLIMLLEAGTPLLKSLKTLSERSERGAVRGLVSDIAQFVEMGNPLWQAFERHPRQFGPVFVNLVKASEASGTLVTVLDRLVEYRQRRGVLIRRVRSAMIYPVVVLLACFGVIMIIGKYVLPEFSKIFEQIGEGGVPDFTKRFIATVDAITNGTNILVTLIVLVVLFVLYKWLTTKPLYRLKADKWKLRIPYVGPNILRKTAIVEMTQNLQLLLGSGLSMMVTLDLVRNAVHNRAVGNVMQDLRDSVERGEGIEQPLRDVPRIIPAVVTDMLVTGEESGQLDRIAGQVAETYEEEVGIHINTLAELMPPILALVMGAFVLLLALAVFVPLIAMLDQLQGAG